MKRLLKYRTHEDNKAEAIVMEEGIVTINVNDLVVNRSIALGDLKARYDKFSQVRYHPYPIYRTHNSDFPGQRHHNILRQ